MRRGRGASVAPAPDPIVVDARPRSAHATAGGGRVLGRAEEAE